MASPDTETERAPLPQPEYPTIATFVDVAQPADVDALYRELRGRLEALKGPRAEQARKVTKAIERTEELMHHLLQVRESIGKNKKARP
jgi:hypothetical protein